MNTTTKTSPSAIARIIKKDVGYPTVPWGWEGVNVSKGAIKGTVAIDCNFEVPGRGVSRMRNICDVLAAKGYTIVVQPSGTYAIVGRGE